MVKVDLFRETMSRLTGAVSVVTSEVDERDWVLTISSCCSISMNPPLLMISLENNKVSTESILKTKEFKVNILSENQLSLAKYGAKPGATKFLDDYLAENNIDQSSLEKNSLASIECELYKDISAGDHTMFLGLIKDIKLGEFTKPLVYYSRNFSTVIKK